MPRTLVTGGAGFIGSHLCDKLIDEGHHVVCMDNFITGREDNIAHLTSNSHFSFVKHDVSTYIDIDGPVDYILHFASPASPDDYLKYPIQTLKVGSLGTHNALGLAKKKNATLLLASTSEVYGDPLEHPQKESYWGNVNPIGIRGVYDEAKRFAEAITMAYHRYHGVNTRIVRIFNTYGPRMRQHDGRVVSNFINQALHGQALTIYGDGSQTRSFQYVDDLVDGVYKLMLSDYSDPVNIGNPGEYTIAELSKIISEMVDKGISVEYKPLPQDDPKQRKPDISCAQSILKWSPKVSVHEGLQKTIQYFEQAYVKNAVSTNI